MPSGSTTANMRKPTAVEAESDIFSFAGGSDLAFGMTGLALMWSTPWRAAMVIATEALRESGTRG